ncbi:TetR/AcrR family transcriptional regulator [Streptomyces sp. A012304]|uniref:TetR/AcrR family transcriptional regulator n=1 Tax=Streptomyces sp. A012304 TaxID=375446 RepID=UPI0022323767|nr:TetR/AcrR family transcriptional regulator C-terminal domain-containing protein [Streptomyces sp. A012304]GKQ36632.1 TetR family transcriptional regulator [Streptomyces sp. A012304]
MAAKTNQKQSEKNQKQNEKPVPSVWARQRREPEQPTLSREAIVREAIAMADADGVDALSMRKLAARLNAGAASLYRHVATKDELMELAVDAVAAEIHVPPADSADWRTAVTEAAASFRATVLRHPWLSSVLGQAGLVYLGPNLMSFSERLAALFTGAGFPEPERSIETVLGYVIGISTTEAAWLLTVARSGETEAEFIARLAPAAQEAAAGHDHLRTAYADITPATADPAALRDAKFTFGLDVVLDGLALRLER